MPVVQTPLLTRLYAKIAQPNDVGCQLWTGGCSRGSGRNTEYGIIREGRRGTRLWRVNRLVLILQSVPDDVHGEELLEWVRRVDRQYTDMEAAHQCDQSLCSNADHLRWESHPENVQLANWRRRQQRRLARAS